MEITLRRRGRGLGAFKASPLPWEAGGELPAPCPWGTGGGRAGQEVPHLGPSSGALGGLQGLWVGGRGGARSCTASVPVATATCLCRSIACTGMRCAVGEGAGGHTGDGEPGDASPRPPVTPAEALHRAQVSFCHLGRMPSPKAQIQDLRSPLEVGTKGSWWQQLAEGTAKPHGQRREPAQLWGRVPVPEHTPIATICCFFFFPPHALTQLPAKLPSLSPTCTEVSQFLAALELFLLPLACPLQLLGARRCPRLCH